MLGWQPSCALEVFPIAIATALRATATLAPDVRCCDTPAIRNRRLRNRLKNTRPKASFYRKAIAMTSLVRQRPPRHKQRTVSTGTDPVQVMLTIVAALAVTPLMALDFYFS